MPRRLAGGVDSERLAEADRAKLVRVLGMLGSDFPGERDNAAVLASRLLRERGLGWDAVLAPPAVSTAAIATDWRAAVRHCLARSELLTAWEVAFLVNVAKSGQPSPKQVGVVGRIAKRIDWSR